MNSHRPSIPAIPAILEHRLYRHAAALCLLFTATGFGEMPPDTTAFAGGALVSKAVKPGKAAAGASPAAPVPVSTAASTNAAPPVSAKTSTGGKPVNAKIAAVENMRPSDFTPGREPVGQPVAQKEKNAAPAAAANPPAAPAPAAPRKPQAVGNEDGAAMAPKGPAGENQSKSSDTRVTDPFTQSIVDRLSALPYGEVMRVQLFLDGQAFTPGKIDGLPGDFSVLAIEQWLSADHSRSLETLFERARTSVSQMVVPFTVPEFAVSQVGSVPGTLSDKAGAPVLPYGSILEFVAERFHTDENTLRRLNPAMDLNALAVGQILAVPNVRPFEIEKVREFAIGDQKSETMVIIRHNLHLLEVRTVQSVLVASFPITVGGKAEDIRTGRWSISEIKTYPRFRWDEQMLKTGTAGKESYDLPPGPNNPVGVLWCSLKTEKGEQAHIGVHGTDNSSRIGRNQSSGCIRLANWDVVRFAHLVKPGTPVFWDQSWPLQKLKTASATTGL